MNNIEKTFRVAITHGDINGIGYELIFKTFAEAEILEMFTPIIYGSLKAASHYEKVLESNCRLNIVKTAAEAVDGKLNFIDVCEGDIEIKPGQVTAASSAAASRAVGRAMADYVGGLFDVLVAAPANESELPAIMDALKQLPEVQSSHLMPIFIYGNDTVKVASVTGRVGENDALQMVSEEDIVERATTFRNALRRDVRIDNPRIAVLKFAGDDEARGKVVTDAIAPAIKRLHESGLAVFGPYAPNDMFEGGWFTHFDGVLGLYEDQVLLPFKHLYGETGFAAVLGLPMVLTAPLQGPSFGIAGKCKADETSMRNAIYMAIDIARSRFYFDQAFANPLPKLYHEHREDGDKARFTVKKFIPKEQK